MTEEDEAFAELERRLELAKSMGKKEATEGSKGEYRNEIIEEVAKELEQEFTLPFGADTIASFAAWIRGLKR